MLLLLVSPMIRCRNYYLNNILNVKYNPVNGSGTGHNEKGVRADVKEPQQEDLIKYAFSQKL